MYISKHPIMEHRIAHNLGRSQTEREISRSFFVLENFETAKPYEIGEEIIQSEVNTVYIIGAGSSSIFPAKKAVNSYRRLTKNGKAIPNLQVEAHFAGSVKVDDLAKNSFIFFGSNSGETREIKKLLMGIYRKDLDYFGVGAHIDSMLTIYCKDKFYLLDQPYEKAVAATKSVVEQALFYDAVIHYLAGKKFKLSKGNEITGIVGSQMRQNFEQKIPIEIVARLKKAGTIYWIDNNLGVAEELKWKTAEILGKRACYLEGTEILHGPGETIKRDDMIIMVNSRDYSQEDIRAVNDLAVSVKARFLLTGKKNGNVDSLDNLVTEEIHGSGGSDYLNLSLGLNLLRTVAVASGVNPDKTKIAKKHRH